jgi:putative IMPACT (imprinted ancient) family translation regulator
MSTDEALTTLQSGSYWAELEIKKSRFLGYAQRTETWKEAQDYVATVRSEHPKARHVCFGFVAGVNPVQERCSDDGEPTGTAGVPILGKFRVA